MFIPFFLVWNYVSHYPWYTGTALQLFGLFLLYTTRFTGRMAPKLGIRYYVFSSIIRPLGILAISLGWVEIFSVGGPIPFPEIMTQYFPWILFIVFILIILILLLDPFWSRLTGAGIIFFFLLFFFEAMPGIEEHVVSWVSLFIIGMSLGIWSIVVLGLRRSFFYVRSDDPLITGGPYKYCRHPQFAAALIMAWASAIAFQWGIRKPDIQAFYIANLFLFTLGIIYITFGEERDLLARFGEKYSNYCRFVPRFTQILRTKHEFNVRKNKRFKFYIVNLIWLSSIIIAIFLFRGLPEIKNSAEAAPVAVIQDINRLWHRYGVYRHAHLADNFLDIVKQSGKLPQELPDYESLLVGRFGYHIPALTLFYCDQIYLPDVIVDSPDHPPRYFHSSVSKLPFPLNCTDKLVTLATAVNVDNDPTPMVWLESWALNSDGKIETFSESIGDYKYFALDDFTNEYTDYYRKWQKWVSERIK